MILLTVQSFGSFSLRFSDFSLRLKLPVQPHPPTPPGGQGAHPSLLQVHWVGVHCQHVLAHMGPLNSGRAATSLLWSVLPKEGGHTHTHREQQWQLAHVSQRCNDPLQARWEDRCSGKLDTDRGEDTTINMQKNHFGMTSAPRCPSMNLQVSLPNCVSCTGFQLTRCNFAFSYGLGNAMQGCRWTLMTSSTEHCVAFGRVFWASPANPSSVVFLRLLPSQCQFTQDLATSK